MNATDAIEFILAGSSVVQIGTASFIDPGISLKVIQGIEEYMDRHGVKSISELIGAMEA